jgi:AraC-like DNA-binding protein
MRPSRALKNQIMGEMTKHSGRNNTSKQDVKHGTTMSRTSLRRIARVGTGWAVYQGDVGDESLHAHRAVQVCIARETHVIVDLGENTICASSAVIKCGERHALRRETGIASVLYVDPDGPVAIGLNALCRDQGAVALDRAIERAARKLIKRLLNPKEDSQQALDDMARVLERAPKTRIHDVRAAAALALITADPGADWPLSHLSRTIGLSSSRLAKAVKAISGLPIRAHIRWLRIQSAVREAAGGAGLTAAAQLGGFSTAEQFSYSFREMFGMPPSAFISCLRN